MNWDRVEGNWKQFTGKVKEKWGKLTDDDLQVINGQQDQLVGRIQERYGVAKDEAAEAGQDLGRRSLVLPLRHPPRWAWTGLAPLGLPRTARKIDEAGEQKRDFRVALPNPQGGCSCRSKIVRRWRR